MDDFIKVYTNLHFLHPSVSLIACSCHRTYTYSSSIQASHSVASRIGCAAVQLHFTHLLNT